MPKSSEIHFLQQRLATAYNAGTYRQLPGHPEGIDFWSNDYLGFSRLLDTPTSALADGTTSPGSRLISGDHPSYTAVERRIATFHGFPAALVFGSGYLANVGLLSCIGRRTDTILYDELIHASCRDGIRLSQATARKFRHNEVAHLAELIERSRKDGQVFVVTEGRFSMDGDQAPLPKLAAICESLGAHLIVDEAHSIGIDGPQGRGLVTKHGLQAQVFAVVYTYGKAPGYHGAAVAGSERLRDYLINFSRPFIYTTAPRPEFWYGLSRVYDILESEQEKRMATLSRLAVHFQQQGPIQIIPLPGNEAVLQAERRLLNAGFLVKGIRSPTVPAGRERLRICLHAFNTEEEVERLLETLSPVILAR